MNSTELLRQLQQIETASWQSLGRGQALLLVDDARLEFGAASAANVIIPPTSDSKPSPSTLREQALERASQLLEDYYRTHPLTAKGFSTQVDDLINRLGAVAFSAPPGQLPDCSLFVEAGTVVAEPRHSPRHRYGIYCELNRPLSGASLEQQVRHWLYSSEAYASESSIS